MKLGMDGGTVSFLSMGMMAQCCFVGMDGGTVPFLSVGIVTLCLFSQWG